MKVNFNKDTLVKNRFWIVLGAAICVILVGMFYLQLYVDAEDAVKGLKNELQKAKSASTGLPYQNSNTIKVREEFALKAKKLESAVWINAYKVQENLFQWSPQIEEEFKFLNGKFANTIQVDALNNDPKAWPADKAIPTDDTNLMHGILSNLSRDWFRIKNREGKEVQFYVTNNVLNVNVVGQNQPVLFANMKEFLGNKLLAVGYQNGRYFNDSLTVSEQRTFAESYKSQIHDILKEVDPLDDKGNGVVQLRNYLFNREEFPEEKMTFIRYVTQPWDLGNDISPEAWIAQENLWVQREIYRILREANEKISTFEDEWSDKKKSPPPGYWEQKNKSYSFKNSYFEVILSLQKDNSLKFKIKNLQKKRQKLDDLTFRIKMSPGFEPEPIKMSSQPLEPMGDKQDRDWFEMVVPFKAEFAPRKGIYSVKQVLTWENAAVKRIDHISIGSNAGDDISHSHRTYPLGLRPLEEVAAEEKKDDKGGILKGSIAPVRDGGGGSGGAGNKGMLAHGLWKYRYLEVSEQSRRIPVSITIIVDQEHVDRVLTAFNNSRLRFLDTQVLLNAYTGSMQPPVIEEKKKVGGVGVFPTIPIGPKTGITPTRPDNNVGNSSTAGQDQETNMEMVIYGIMTLYQRYPPRPPLPTAAKKQ